MVTVFERLTAYTKRTKFIFPTKHKMAIGIYVASRFREIGGKTEELPIVESNENNEVYRVFAYPLSFITEIDITIDKYVERLRASRKKITERPATIQPAHPISYTSATPKRKRRPINTTQPFFSGKLLKDK